MSNNILQSFINQTYGSLENAKKADQLADQLADQNPNAQPEHDEYFVDTIDTNEKNPEKIADDNLRK